MDQVMLKILFTFFASNLILAQSQNNSKISGTITD